MPGWIPWSVAAIACASVAIGAEMTIAKLPPPALDVNMLFVPPAAMTRAAATGYENVIADTLWLGLLQYYGDRVVSDDRTAVNLHEMFDLITDLDPRFYFAYWLGSWALGDNQQGDLAVALVAKGERLNPGDYNYPYLQGFMHFLFRRDYQAAAACFERSAGLPGAPRFARTMAARMYQKQGQTDLALQIWENLYDKADKATREIARRNVERLRLELANKGRPSHPR